MLSAFTWYANHHFTVNNGGIRKNEIFRQFANTKILSKVIIFISNKMN